MLHAVPFTVHLEHGFFNYQPNFFEALAKHNGYETLGVWVGPDWQLGSLIPWERDVLDYLTLTPTYLSNYFAEIVMEPERREAILERTRGIIRRNLPRLERWIHTHDDIFTYIPPRAGAIALVRYGLPIGSVALFDRLRRDQSVLITPGAHFGIRRYMRIGYGGVADHLKASLARIDTTLLELQRRAARPRPARTGSVQARHTAAR